MSLENEIEESTLSDAGSSALSGTHAESPVLNDKPALVINVQSWATPVVGILMLVVGLLAGYFARPILSPMLPGGADPLSAPVASVQTPDPADQQNREQMMAFLNEQTRHFKGDPDAKVTIIEFGDFQ